jgi:hypothetical protein
MVFPVSSDPPVVWSFGGVMPARLGQLGVRFEELEE